jgi:hypothetical protein
MIKSYTTTTENASQNVIENRAKFHLQNAA